MLALPALALADGWSTNWPSQQFPRRSYNQLWECYSAIVERCTVTGVAAPSAPAWYRSNRASLTGFKSKLQTLIPYFLDTSLVDSTNTFNSWYEGRGFTSAPPYLTITGLCATLEIPTNYFDYTPWRCLSGLGVFSNDAAAPYLHGYTNSYTAAGGDAFPGSRATWYTTDYGWCNLTGIINRLVWTFDTAYDYNSLSGDARYGVSDRRGSWSDAMLDASNVWGSASSGDAGANTHGVYDGEYRATVWAGREKLSSWKLAGTVTNYGHSVAIYEAWLPAQIWIQFGSAANWDGITGMESWDVYGRDVTTNFRLYWTSSEVWTNRVVSDYIGSTNRPVPPGAWCEAPSGSTNDTARGHVGLGDSGESHAVWQWDGTNGFRYK